MLQLRNLRRRYGDVVALDGLSLDVPPGQLVGLLGPNGAGKSTAMRIALGLLRPDDGEVSWRGRPVGQAERRCFGYLPEERGLYPRMRVRDQVVYFGRMHGLSRGDATASADRWLERLGVAARSTDRVDALSLGNQQRVQLAAALVHEPDLLVLDEPFSGLDPVAVDALSEVLAERAAAGTGVLFSSHQLDLVEDVCESVAVVDRGRLVLSGVVQELKAASGRRQLRVLVEGDGRVVPPMAGVVVAGSDAGGTRLLLEPDVDPMAVLAAAAGAGRVVDFCMELPSLSDLFREAIRSNE
ncbi:MAG: ATP-binding cassette domain-containing protein [Actinomycetota bacterium]|nr:ATP-binding cassette domain-containing protein [Actinomycetota bacterium]MDQ6946581.1 ATP-binding cassette domain-containing protein [Actinomycetota bacterium]